MATQKTVHSHNYQHFEDLQLSAKEFYSTLANLIKEYQYPGVKIGSKTLKEDGFFSSSREYLCITKDDFNYYVCAAPFGRSFFISWWLQERNTDLTRFVEWLRGKKEKSYYEIDTLLIFTNSVEALVKKAVEKVKAQYGIRETVEPVQ